MAFWIVAQGLPGLVQSLLASLPPTATNRLTAARDRHISGPATNARRKVARTNPRILPFVEDVVILWPAANLTNLIWESYLLSEIFARECYHGRVSLPITEKLSACGIT